MPTQQRINTNPVRGKELAFQRRRSQNGELSVTPNHVYHLFCTILECVYFSSERVECLFITLLSWDWVFIIVGFIFQWVW